jgi:hypothetical protein
MGDERRRECPVFTEKGAAFLYSLLQGKKERYKTMRGVLFRPYLVKECIIGYSTPHKIN